MDTNQEIERAVSQHKLGHLAAEPQRLQGDGSDRRFFRLTLQPAGRIVAVFPSLSAGAFSREAASAVAINRHLAAKGVPVPRLLAYAPESGLMLYEDAGDTHLAELASNCQGDTCPDRGPIPTGHRCPAAHADQGSGRVFLLLVLGGAAV